MAAAMNQAVGEWPGVRITPMFGRWGYFVGPDLFGCFPLRPGESDLWVRLDRADHRRALSTEGVVPHRRFAARGWVELRIETAEELTRGVRWLARSYRWHREGRSPGGPDRTSRGAGGHIVSPGEKREPPAI